jgi:hypothetical protein
LRIADDPEPPRCQPFELGSPKQARLRRVIASWIGNIKPDQIASGVMAIAPQGHSWAQTPQPLQ